MNEELERDIETRTLTPAVARVVKDSLQRLKDGGGGPEMREIARDLLDGRISLRDLTRSPVYAHVFTDQVRRYRAWEASLSDEQRQRIATEVEEMYGPAAVEGAFWGVAGRGRCDRA